MFLTTAFLKKRRQFSRKIEQVQGVLRVSDNSQNRKRSKRVARVACQGGAGALVIPRSASEQHTCRTAHMEGDQSCPYGCLGLGDCLDACRFSAIKINEQGLAEIDESRCTGCGLCAKACPRQLLIIGEREKSVFVRCSAPGYGKYKRQLCRAACIGCANCRSHCPYGAISIVHGLAVIDYQLCCNCGECLDCCPSCLDYSKVIGS